MFDDETHKKVLGELKSRYGVEVIDHPSVVNPEFRYVELLLPEPGRESDIRNIVSSIIGSSRVKVDWIDTSS